MVRSIKLWLALVLISLSGLAASAELPDFTKLIDTASPAVVKISTTNRSDSDEFQKLPEQQIPEIFKHFFEPWQAPERESHSMGSGFFISEDGYLLTNEHVIEGADQIIVRLVDRREYEAKVVGIDPRSDLAMLKIDETNLPYLTLDDSDSLKVGEWVVAIGSPFGLDFSASAGIVSALGRSIPSGKKGNYVPFIQTDVAINPGNSGGPLFNLDGKVVGVNSQIYTRSGGSIGLSFAIPASVVKNVIVQLRQKGRVDRGWLGVVIQEVDRDLADSFGLSKPSGALVVQVEPGGPAERGGIKVGDIITEFSDIEIVSSGELPHAVGATPPGQTVDVEVLRKGKRKTLKVTVDSLATITGEETVPDVPQLEGGRLGVIVHDLDSQTMNELRLSGGVQVTDVISRSPAAKAGLRPGDVIAQLGFEEIGNTSDFSRIVEGLPNDTLLPIRFFRDGQPSFRTIMLDK